MFHVPGTGELRLIDLQRMQRFKTLPWRWRVKDIAALWYSWPDAGLDESSWQAFFELYCRYCRIDKNAEALMRRVRAKAELIRRHDEKSKRTRPVTEIEDPRT